MRLVCCCAALVGVVPAVASAQTAEDGFRRCSATFHVLHDDRVGELRIDGGMHDLAVAGEVTCAQAPGLVARFLQNWDGRLGGGWRVVAADREFVRAGSEDAIRVSAATPRARDALSCPEFTILNDTRIGSLRLRAGRYAMRRLSTRLGCPQAARDLRELLQSTAGVPFPWRAESLAGSAVTFRDIERRGYGFRIRRAFSGTGGGGTYPAAPATRCRGTFLVQNPNSIGALRIAKGMHHLNVFGAVTCEDAVDAFKVFLGRPLGNLPSPWRVRPATAGFVRGSAARSGFWIDRAYEG
jgi:hypothetical protein